MSDASRVAALEARAAALEEALRLIAENNIPLKAWGALSVRQTADEFARSVLARNA